MTLIVIVIIYRVPFVKLCARSRKLIIRNHQNPELSVVLLLPPIYVCPYACQALKRFRPEAVLPKRQHG